MATSRQVLSAATFKAQPMDRRHVARTVAIPPDDLLHNEYCECECVEMYVSRENKDPDR